MNRISWRGMLGGAIGMLLVLLLILLIVVLTGGYNIAATERHSAPVEWAFDMAFRNSVERRAAELDAPVLTSAMVSAGAGEYKTMCEHCHGGVNVSSAEWSHGMRPNPPPLAEEAAEWSAAEVFWLVKHGARMTGMPAFGATHDDQTIWNIAAFVKALPQMSAEEYAAYPSEHPGGSEGEATHSHAGLPERAH